MRITSSLLAFIFLGVAAAGVIPEIAARGNTVAGGKGGHGGHSVGLPSGVSGHPFPSGKHHPAPVSRRDNPTDVPHPSVSPSEVSGDPKPTGKDSRPAGSRRDDHPVSPSDVSDDPKATGKNPRPVGSRRSDTTGIPRPPVSPSDVSDDPKPTGKNSRPAGSRRNSPTDIPHPPASLSDASDLPKPTGKSSHPAGSRRDNPSSHPKASGKHSHPAASRRANPTDVNSHIPAPHSTDSKDPHSHHPAARRNAQTDVPSLPTNTASQGSDHPERTGEPSRPLASHEPRVDNPTIVHSIHPISRRASPTDTDSPHHQSGSERPKPTGKAT